MTNAAIKLNTKLHISLFLIISNFALTYCYCLVVFCIIRNWIVKHTDRDSHATLNIHIQLEFRIISFKQNLLIWKTAKLSINFNFHLCSNELLKLFLYIYLFCILFTVTFACWWTFRPRGRRYDSWGLWVKWWRCQFELECQRQSIGLC